ncbi:MAG: MFS transporter, partial [bacterium]
MSETSLPVAAVDRAIRLTYAQAMIGSVYAASTGGMFLIGYALKLQATDVQIGLMTTIPMLSVCVQLLSSALIENGISRRLLTILSAFGNVLGWALVILIPYVLASQTPTVKIGALILIITLVTFFGQISNNARWSWVGDLIPSSFRGTFFGRLTMYGGIIGTIFALVEGRFLDAIKARGIEAFSMLFAFGMIFGIINALLFVPQPDISVDRHEKTENFWVLARNTFSNRALIPVMIFALLWSMQGIAGPFYATYLLRDLKIPFFNLGLINSIVTLVMLVSSQFWGRIVDRYGCRPVVIATVVSQIPLPFIWIWLTYPHAVYMVLPFIHVLVGFASAGLAVALNTLIYKVIPPAGRSIQAAIYSIIVV